MTNDITYTDTLMIGLIIEELKTNISNIINERQREKTFLRSINEVFASWNTSGITLPLDILPSTVANTFNSNQTLEDGDYYIKFNTVRPTYIQVYESTEPTESTKPTKPTTPKEYMPLTVSPNLHVDQPIYIKYDTGKEYYTMQFENLFICIKEGDDIDGHPLTLCDNKPNSHVGMAIELREDTSDQYNILINTGEKNFYLSPLGGLNTRDRSPVVLDSHEPRIGFSFQKKTDTPNQSSTN
jgi:hypothetical protein